VCEREREREGQREKKKKNSGFLCERETEREPVFVCVGVCLSSAFGTSMRVCVCCVHVHL